jgi:sulfate permease, SulP family
MTAIDATGLQALKKLADIVHGSGRHLILCGAREQPSRLMRHAEFDQDVGSENICASVAVALERARILHSTLSSRGQSEYLPDQSSIGLVPR